MKRMYGLTLAAMLLTTAATFADAKGKPGGGSAVSTNYGCSTLSAGKLLTSSDGTTQKKLLMATNTCYLCNTTTRVCTIQTPTSLVGWTFVY